MKHPATSIPALAALCLSALPSPALEIHVAPDGKAGNDGTANAPLPFEAAVAAASGMLKRSGVPEGGLTMTLRGGRYAFEQPFVLGPEFKGTETKPIVIRAGPGAGCCSMAPRESRIRIRPGDRRGRARPAGRLPRRTESWPPTSPNPGLSRSSAKS